MNADTGNEILHADTADYADKKSGNVRRTFGGASHISINH